MTRALALAVVLISFVSCFFKEGWMFLVAGDFVLFGLYSVWRAAGLIGRKRRQDYGLLEARTDVRHGLQQARQEALRASLFLAATSSVAAFIGSQAFPTAGYNELPASILVGVVPLSTLLFAVPALLTHGVADCAVRFRRPSSLFEMAALLSAILVGFPFWFLDLFLKLSMIAGWHD